MGTGKAARKDDRNTYNPANSQGQIDAQRAGLAFLSLGTSEIKTGAGEYGDGTVADALFPETINNWMLNDRQAAREDAKAAVGKEAQAIRERAANRPDATAVLLKKAAAGQLKTKFGRASTFLTEKP